MAQPIKITLLGDITDLAAKLGEATGELDSFGKKAGGLALVAGGGIAAGLTAGLSEALERDTGNDLLAAQIGATPDQAKKLGEAAGSIFASGLGESVGEANEALKGLWQSGLVPASATTEQIGALGGRLMDVAKIMGEEVGPTAKTAGQMVRTGMAKDFDQAMDILVRGTQIGVNANEDLLDTFNEYSTQFRKVGIDGPTALGLMNQALQGGARDADIAADAIKEFSLLSIDGSKGAADAYKTLGLNSDQMIKTLAGGGPKAAEALNQVFERMRALQDPVQKNTVAIGLFGTQAEDLGAALGAMNPATAVAGLGQVEGAAKSAGDTLHDNASSRLSAFGRQLKEGFVEAAGTYAVPVLEKLAEKVGSVSNAVSAGINWVREYQTPIGVVAGAITVLLLPALVSWGVTATASGYANVVAWLTSTGTATTSSASQVLAHWAVIGGWIKSAGQAVASGAVMVAQWVLMGTQSLLQAARMAAAWLIAMGPIAIVIAAVVALVALVVANWDAIKNATVAVFEWIWEKIKQVFNFIKDLFLNFTGPGLIIKHWDSIKNATSQFIDGLKSKVSEGINWITALFTDLPRNLGNFAGRMWSAALDLGRAVIDGIGSGLSKAGDFVNDLQATIGRACRSVINGFIDMLNYSIPDKLGWGPASIDIPANPIPKLRAMGGPASGWTRVGERGAEDVWLPRGSTVIPNHASGGNGGVVVNVTSTADPYLIGREVAWALRVAPR